MAEAKQGTEKKIVKKTPHDFIFGKFLGEGSFSTVCILPFVLNHALKEYVLVFMFFNFFLMTLVIFLFVVVF